MNSDSLRAARVRDAAMAQGLKAHRQPTRDGWMLVTPDGSRPVDPAHRWGAYPLTLAELEQLLGVDPDAPAQPDAHLLRRAKKGNTR